MAKKAYAPGDVVTSAWLNSIMGINAATGHVHDGADNDGHAPKVNLAEGAHVTGQLPDANIAAVAGSKVSGAVAEADHAADADHADTADAALSATSAGTATAADNATNADSADLILAGAGSSDETKHIQTVYLEGTFAGSGDQDIAIPVRKMIGFSILISDATGAGAHYWYSPFHNVAAKFYSVKVISNGTNETYVSVSSRGTDVDGTKAYRVVIQYLVN